MFKKRVLFNVSLNSLPEEPKWYLLATAFNYEQKVAKSVKDMAANHPEIKAVFLPFSYKRTITQPKKGKPTVKISAIRGTYSGYVFVKMVMNSKMWPLINNISGVAATMATSGVPQYIEDDEIAKIKDTLTYDGFDDEQLETYLQELDNEWFHLNADDTIIYKSVKQVNPKTKPIRKRNSDRWVKLQDLITDDFPF